MLEPSGRCLFFDDAIYDSANEIRPKCSNFPQNAALPEKPKPSGNAVLDKLLAGSVRGPFGTLYDDDYRTTEEEARDAIRVMITKDRERLHAALAKLDRFESELDSGVSLFTTHIEPLLVA